MEVKFIEKRPTTTETIHGTIYKKFNDDITCIYGVTAVKYAERAILAYIHFSASEDEEDAYQCELLESPCKMLTAVKLRKHLEIHGFNVDSVLNYFGMRKKNET